MTASDLHAYHQAVAALIAAAKACCESGPGAEPWDHLCDAIEAAELEVPEEYLRRAQVELDERLGGVGVDP